MSDNCICLDHYKNLKLTKEFILSWDDYEKAAKKGPWSILFKVLPILMVFIVIMMFIGFGTGLLNLEYLKFYKPRKENIEREVFENTKSYIHGAAEDLGKYYEEYTKAESASDKETIVSVIKMRFAELDETKLQNQTLRSFLISTRGY